MRNMAIEKGSVNRKWRIQRVRGLGGPPVVALPTERVMLVVEGTPNASMHIKALRQHLEASRQQPPRTKKRPDAERKARLQEILHLANARRVELGLAPWAPAEIDAQLQPKASR